MLLQIVKPLEAILCLVILGCVNKIDFDCCLKREQRQRPVSVRYDLWWGLTTVITDTCKDGLCIPPTWMKYDTQYKCHWCFSSSMSYNGAISPCEWKLIKKRHKRCMAGQTFTTQPENRVFLSARVGKKVFRLAFIYYKYIYSRVNV